MAGVTVTTTEKTSNGIGFIGLLTIVFIVLKLLGKIHWSWLWVLSPIWIAFLATVVFIGLGFAVVYALERWR